MPQDRPVHLRLDLCPCPHSLDRPYDLHPPIWCGNCSVVPGYLSKYISSLIVWTQQRGRNLSPTQTRTKSSGHGLVFYTYLA